jgi:hypothetical protein
MAIEIAPGARLYDGLTAEQCLERLDAKQPLSLTQRHVAQLMLARRTTELAEQNARCHEAARDVVDAALEWRRDASTAARKSLAQAVDLLLALKGAASDLDY